VIQNTLLVIQNALRGAHPMPGKPTEQEDEYFARLEFERHGRLIRS